MKSVVAFSAASLLATASLLTSPAARAEEVSADAKAAARDFAIQGIQLAQSGKCQEALDPLERAEKLYHAPTILAWIGECQLELGRLVEGTENLNRVAREQLPAGSPPAYATAQERARKLAAEATPRIAKLTIEVSPANVEGLAITIDDKPLATALVGAARPTDPGTRRIVAEAPGYQRVETSVDLADGARETIQLELLVDPNAPKPEPTTTTPDPKPAAATSSSGNGLGTWGWVSLGAGGLLVAGGGVTGMMAVGAKGELDCPGNVCSDPTEIGRLNDARAYATVSTILFGVGGAAVAAGIVLLVLDEEPKTEVGGATLRPLVGFGSLGVDGTF